MVRGSRSDMEASDIATSESRSELVGNGMSFCCFPFCSASVRRVSRDATICGVTYSGGNVVELSGELPLEGHGEEWGRGERRAASRDEDEEGTSRSGIHAEHVRVNELHHTTSSAVLSRSRSAFEWGPEGPIDARIIGFLSCATWPTTVRWRGLRACETRGRPFPVPC